MSRSPFDSTDVFVDRHVGPTPADAAAMLAALGYDSLEAFLDATVPPAIRASTPLRIGAPLSEFGVLDCLRGFAEQNRVFRSYIGMGYANCMIPPVLRRNIFEDPGWYTPYTPYQAEIAQGRLEALLNFQTMVADLTALAVANASLLDEATAAAEAMTLCLAVDDAAARSARGTWGASGADPERKAFFVAADCHPQTIAVVRTRAQPLDVEILVGDPAAFDFRTPVAGVLLQYPATDGVVTDYRSCIARAHDAGTLVVMAADILSLALLVPPGELGADVAVGSTQRFGVPLGFGGPHAAYFATRDAYKRHMPGRLIGVSVDRQGRSALRLALQTREQHIRRARATSNICTSQVLPAVMAGMYAVYHGPDGIRRIAERVHAMTRVLAAAVRKLGYTLGAGPFFDTLRIACEPARADALIRAALDREINLRRLAPNAVGIALDETTNARDCEDLLAIFAEGRTAPTLETIDVEPSTALPAPLRRTSAYLTHPVFNRYRSETEMMRYLHRLQAKDLSLTTSMTSLGSCTMKLNATVEMLPVTWRGFSALHPFVPAEQALGYRDLIAHFETMLVDITGFDTISLQPNAGSQGEYTGLLMIRAYHRQRGEAHRTVCLIPASAHGTNPASATMAGMRIVAVSCDAGGNIDLADLREKAAAHQRDLAALMITYPSTHGVFEEEIRAICDVVHRHGGQVYMDGANMNALVGLCRPAELGIDVCHLNLHKTFCIPHGGGGPGMGPIGVKAHLAPFAPTHPVVAMGGRAQSIGTVAAAPWGSPSILPIPFAYIAMMGSAGLRHATAIAILNANYIAHRLHPYFPVVFTGRNGRVAHECIVDLRPLKTSAGIEVEDVAKRLMDYGFHAPTMSWPIAGTLMIEPTESESKTELDRFCEAMIAIHGEIQEIAAGTADRENNPLKNAPHTAAVIASDRWDRPYSRERAAFPVPWLRDHKYWPPVGRIDNPYGDRNLVCTCPSMPLS